MYPIRVGKECLERGYQVYGLCVSGTRVAKGMEEVGLDTYQVESKGKLIFSEIFKINQWLKERNIEVIHCHKSGDILVSALLNILTNRRVLFTEHMGVTRPKKDLYHKWVYSHVDQILSISDETLKRNLKALPVSENKIERLWLGTDIPDQPITNSNFIAKTKELLNIPEPAIVIGTIGRICDGKGQRELIQAYQFIAEKIENVHLLIVGGLNESEGADAKYVIEIKKLVSESEHRDRIHFAGFQKDTPAMFSVMDIVCLPYFNEAFGLTAIEAMAAEKAIVAANTGALPEILEDTALLCDPKDPKELSNTITQYLNHHALMDNNAVQARARAQNSFAMATHISKLVQYYNLNTL